MAKAVPGDRAQQTSLNTGAATHRPRAPSAQLAASRDRDTLHETEDGNVQHPPGTTRVQQETPAILAGTLSQDRGARGLPQTGGRGGLAGQGQRTPAQKTPRRSLKSQVTHQR